MTLTLNCILLHCTVDNFGQKLLFEATPASKAFTRMDPGDVNAQLPLTSFQLTVIKPPGGKSQSKCNQKPGKCNQRRV